MDPTSATGDGTRESVVKEVAGVTIVALVDEDPVCETEDGVEERGVEKPDWDPAPS